MAPDISYAICIRVVHREISHQVTWFFLVYTRAFRRMCIQRKIKSRVGYSRYTTRKHTKRHSLTALTANTISEKIFNTLATFLEST